MNRHVRQANPRFPTRFIGILLLSVRIPVSQILQGVTFPETRCNEKCFLFVCLFLQWFTGAGLGNKVAFACVSLVFLLNSISGQIFLNLKSFQKRQLGFGPIYRVSR